jgi:hypothetical protein
VNPWLVRASLRSFANEFGSRVACVHQTCDS